MRALWCLLVVVALSWCHRVSAQKDVFDCFNLYNEQHSKLAIIKDEAEKESYDCEAKKVQWDCLIRVLEKSQKDRQKCLDLEQKECGEDSKSKACHGRKPCDNLGPCIELKVNEAKKLFMNSHYCSGCGERVFSVVLLLLPLLLAALNIM